MTTRHYRRRFCGTVLPAWLPVAKRPNGAMCLGHLSQHHRDQVGPCLRRMAPEDPPLLPHLGAVPPPLAREFLEPVGVIKGLGHRQGQRPLLQAEEA
jgi:hypothetical protein